MQKYKSFLKSKLAAVSAGTTAMVVAGQSYASAGGTGPGRRTRAAPPGARTAP